LIENLVTKTFATKKFCYLLFNKMDIPWISKTKTEPQVLTRNFLRMLHSFHTQEKHCKFKCNKIDPKSLKIPSNNMVLTVASPTSVAPPPTPYESRHASICDALRKAQSFANHIQMGIDVTILIYEGLYIFPAGLMYIETMNNHISFIGLGDVRFVFISFIEDTTSFFEIAATKITMRNIMIFNRFQCSNKLDETRTDYIEFTAPLYTFCVWKGANVHFIECKINAPKSCGIYVTGKKSKCKITNCMFSDCLNPFNGSNHARIFMEDSLIFNRYKIGGEFTRVGLQKLAAHSLTKLD